ncbi:MAG: DegT/DnrJ/EryC1/StrS family aminotransferase [Lentisphaerae bacterium]|nr:DegT/DnrJ/EryC1/StrS family aminotransferase [Lentisphaerota bacterium]
MTKKLAVCGGTPLFKAGEYLIEPWPPVKESTADKIRELYLSRAWSFNSPTEQAFENEYAAYHGAKYGVLMSNGTVTLESALGALGVGPGDEVIVPDLTWIATAMSVRYVGATCVFADIEKSTACLDPDSFERLITPRTKAVIPVHLYGGMADLDQIIAIAKKHGIAVIEDCAHMQGGKWNGRGCGSWGDIGSFSFQQSKTLSAGEAGICLTNDAKLAERLYRAKHIGYSRYDKQGQAGTPPPQDLICHNYRGLAIQAQILRDQLIDLPDVNRRQNEFHNILEQEIKDIPGVRLQSPGRLASPQGYYGQGVIFEGDGFEKIPLIKICQALGEEGTRAFGPTYGRVCKHLLFNMTPDYYRLDPAGYPNSEFIVSRMAVAPHWTMYHSDNAHRLGAAIRKVAENKAELF